jgi:elongation factor P--beta-lysine ligase
MRVSEDDMRKHYRNGTIGHLTVSVKRAFLQERGFQTTSARGAAKASELKENIRKYFENHESVPRTPKRIDAPITDAEMKAAFETKSLHKLAANRLQQWLVRKGLPHVGEKYTDKAGKVRTR